MKFLLIRSNVDPGDHSIGGYAVYTSIYPPLGLMYIGASLENDGHKVQIIDFCKEYIPIDSLKKTLMSSDAVGISLNSYDRKNVACISKNIKEIDPKIPLIIGGPNCTFFKKNSLEEINSADICVIGEGEHVILDLVKYLNGEKKIYDIHGIYYRDNGLIKSGKPIQIIKQAELFEFSLLHY